MDQHVFHSEDEFELLNIAAISSGENHLGPGYRCAVWVQGCAFNCKGCVAPDWIPIRPANLIRPEVLVEHILADPKVEGLTFSGGEPMLQAYALSRLARLARQSRDLSIICFTGFTHNQLIHHPPGPGVVELLEMVDVLIDGPYVKALDDNKGLRGSSNQRIIHLTERLRGFDFENHPRKSILHVNDGHILMVGVPPKGFDNAFQQAVDSANQTKRKSAYYERI